MCIHRRQLLAGVASVGTMVFKAVRRPKAVGALYHLSGCLSAKSRPKVGKVLRRLGAVNLLSVA